MGILGYIERVVRSWGPRGYIAGVKPCPLAEFPEAERRRATGVVKSLDRAVLQAPLSGRPCVYYEIAILFPIRDEGYHRKERVGHEVRGIPFALEDKTGRATIDPAHARIVCLVDQRSFSGAAEASPRERVLLERLELSQRNWGRVGLHYREAVLAIDETITVVGMATRVPVMDAVPQRELGYRDADSATRLHFATTATNQVVISDDPSHRLWGER